MSEEDYKEMEGEMKKYFDIMEGEYSGNYYPIRDMPIKASFPLAHSEKSFYKLSKRMKQNHR